MKPFLLLLLLCASSLGRASAPPKEDDLTELLEGKRKITSLQEIREYGLERGSSLIDIWSGSAWPMYQGSIAARYNDPRNQPRLEAEKKIQWREHWEYFQSSPAHCLACSEQLSPAEKYDLLVGDLSTSLTKYSWVLGKINGGETWGKVPTWRGLCDGWASAAQMMPRPQRNVTLVNPEGIPVTFYPEDIKALGSLLYARAQEPPIFLGKRCRMPLSGLCDDTHPATLHLALVNRVGKLRKSFVVDISSGKEVWNHPVRAYEISYFNVLSDKKFKRFEDAMETFDRRKKFRQVDSRHPETAYILGVNLKVSFADIKSPLVREDKILSRTYIYDLELNSRHEIVGGVAAGKLPDFIWAPKDKTYPLTWVEQRQGKPTTPEMVIRMSQESAANGQPLTVIVEKLFELSK